MKDVQIVGVVPKIARCLAYFFFQDMWSQGVRRALCLIPLTKLISSIHEYPYAVNSYLL